MTRMKLILMLIVLSLSSCVPYIHTDGPYKGKVVELETGKPIEGAVVAAEWTIAAVVHDRFCDAEETVTDKNGDFELPKGECWSWNSFAEMFGPYVVIFKPGYLGYPPLGYNQEQRKTYMPDFTGDEFKDKNQYYVIKLGRPKTREERVNTENDAELPVPMELVIGKLPILYRLKNEERKSLGLQEIPLPGGKK